MSAIQTTQVSQEASNDHGIASERSEQVTITDTRTGKTYTETEYIARLTADLAAANERVKELERELAVMRRAFRIALEEGCMPPFPDCENIRCIDCCLDRARAEVENPNPSNQKDPE